MKRRKRPTTLNDHIQAEMKMYAEMQARMQVLANVVAQQVVRALRSMTPAERRYLSDVEFADPKRKKP
jgi:hypothetical protein